MRNKKKSENLEDVLERLKRAREELRGLKIKRLFVFGSFARRDQKSKSDVDLVVKFSEPIGLFHLYEVKIFLERTLGRKVDLVTEEAIRPEIKSKIRKEMIRAA